MRRACLIILTVLLMVSAAHARMYQWVDPRSGHTQMSGVPPAWYRSGQPGPRIFVFENGQIIDDTRIPVSEDKRQTLREQAFKNAAPMIAAPEATTGATGDTFNSAAPEANDAAAAGTKAETASSSSALAPAPAATATDASAPKNVSPEVLARLKEALERWDREHSSSLSLPASTPTPATVPTPSPP